MKPEETIGNLLRDSGLTVCTAESCTGGNISHRLTLIPGSSSYMRGGVVSYAASVKESLLGVRRGTISRYGVVSAEVAAEMAQGARRILGSTYAVSTTGVAGPGPDGDVSEGTVWIGVSGPSSTITRIVHCNLGREGNIDHFTSSALETLAEFICQNESTENKRI